MRGQNVPNRGNIHDQVESRGPQVYRSINDSCHLQRPPLSEQVLAQNREGKSPKAPSIMPEGDLHMQAGKYRPVLRKREAGELFKRIFEETFTSMSKFSSLFDVEVEVVSHTGNITTVSPIPGSRPQIDNGKSSVLRFPFSRSPCVQQEVHWPTKPRRNV